MDDVATLKCMQRPEPIRVAIVGCGWFGNGLAQQLHRIPGVCPALLVDRHQEKALAAYARMGVAKRQIVDIASFRELRLAARSAAQYAVSTDASVLADAADLGIDVIFDATGDLIGGIEAAWSAIAQRIAFVTVSAEMDGTIGLALQRRAREAGTIYSFAGGDQPAVLAGMIDEITQWGLYPRIAGNCKGFLNAHQTPDGVRPYVPDGQNTMKVCSFADGSKQSLEMAVLGNAYGFYPYQRGMRGPTTTKAGIVASFRDVLESAPHERAYVDYVMGIDGVDQGGGVFVIAETDDPDLRRDLKYLKKGDGPYYLFFRDHHLCYLEAPQSVLSAAAGVASMAPEGRYVDVLAVAKRDIPEGTRLDGIGGFDCYGLADAASTCAESGLLPLGLAESAVATRAISKDTPITYDMVALEDSWLADLRSELEAIALPEPMEAIAVAAH